MKVVVVGGGAIGMMQARSLAQNGCDVVLLDKGVCGKESSWAGGGIVSPLYPWRYSDEVTTLASWSQGYYANLAESLEAESDVDPELCRHGLLVLSVDDEDDAVIWSRTHKYWLRQIDDAELYKLEPHLREGFRHALYMPQVSSIRNPRLGKALRVALERHVGVTIKESQSVTGFILDNGRVKGVKTGQEQIDADVVIVAAGAWSNQLLNLLGLSIPVQPVRGQMVLFKPEHNPVKRVVLRDGKYVIPRRDGRVLAGSTLEYCGFDKSTTQQAREELTDVAIDMFPELANSQVEAHWAGLRPGMNDGIPLIGAIPQFEGLYINAGHFRNGLVLAPASVQLLTQLLIDKPLPFSDKPYDPAKKLTEVG